MVNSKWCRPSNVSERQALFVGSGHSDGWHAALLPLPQFLHPLLVALLLPTSPSDTDTTDVTAAHEEGTWL